LGPLPPDSAPPHRRAIVAIAVGGGDDRLGAARADRPAAADIEQRTGAGDAALGLALAAYAVPIALLSLPFGRAADTLGRRTLLVAGLLFVAVGSVLVAISDSIGVLIAAPPCPREEPRTASAVPALPAVIRATRSGLAAWAAAIMLGSALWLGLVEVVAPLDLDARLGLSSSAIGLLFAASIAVDAAVSPFGGRRGDLRGRRGPAIVGLAATGVSMVALAVLPGVGGTAVALGIYSAGFSLMMAAAVPWLDEAFPGRERGLAYGVQNLVYAAGYAVGPILGGLLLEAGDADLAYGLAAGALGVGALALTIRSRRLPAMTRVPRKPEVAPEPERGRR
jgi:MFS transporter, DHA1 family, solute carrier family 18 (vesicular amine transporter), member 1/2